MACVFPQFAVRAAFGALFFVGRWVWGWSAFLQNGKVAEASGREGGDGVERWRKGIKKERPSQVSLRGGIDWI